MILEDIFESLPMNRVFFEHEIIERRDFVAAVDDLSAYIKANASRNSPFIYLFAPNHIKTVIAYFAIIRAGWIVILLDPAIKPLELEHIQTDAPPSASCKIDAHSIQFNCQQEILFHPLVQKVEESGELEGVCTMVYTAAEDGYPKAAMLTRKNLLTNAQSYVVDQQCHEGSISCALLPFYHLFSLQTGVLGPMMARGSFLIEGIHDLRRLSAIVEDFQRVGVSHIYSVPSIYYLFGMMRETHKKFEDMEHIVSGGYALAESIFLRFFEKTGQLIQEGYGLTEASPICSCQSPEKVKMGSVGRYSTYCEAAILDGQNSPCGTGEIGEVCVKGDHVMKGYYHAPEKTLEVLKEGWLHTGDLGKLDGEGYLYLTGLKKRMLNVGGRNVYPAEVERLLCRHEAIQDAHVYGARSRIQGDTVNAAIQVAARTPTIEQDIRAWCHQNISSYKIPRDIQLFETPSEFFSARFARGTSEGDRGDDSKC